MAERANWMMLEGNNTIDRWNSHCKGSETKMSLMMTQEKDAQCGSRAAREREGSMSCGRGAGRVHTAKSLPGHLI